MGKDYEEVRGDLDPESPEDVKQQSFTTKNKLQGMGLVWTLIGVMLVLGLVSLVVYALGPQQLFGNGTSSNYKNNYHNGHNNNHNGGSKKTKPVIEFEVACKECFDSLPDECRLTPVAFTTLGKEYMGKRYSRWHYNGNMG